MKKTYVIVSGLLGLAACSTTPEAKDAKPVEVQLCDGETTEVLPAGQPVTRAQAQALSNALMAKWQAKNPGKDWVAVERESHTIVPGADNAALAASNPQGQAYGQFTAVDVATWDRETQKLVTAGSKVFHSADELGSTIAVSCDMCHPNASNTHPETYPKFQTQIGRSVLLRDMINWCLEHPVRAQPMAEDDPRLRAMEAYIIAQRRGVKLDYNKH